MKKTIILSLSFLSIMMASCGKKEARINNALNELRNDIEETVIDEANDIASDIANEEITTSAPQPTGARQVPVKLAKSKINGEFGKYFEIVEHDDYFVDVPSNPGLFDKMSISLEIRRIAEGWPNGWTPGTKVANSYIHINILDKKGKKLQGGTVLEPEEEFDDLDVGESKWYSFDLSSGMGEFTLTDEELESIDKVEADDSDLRF